MAFVMAVGIWLCIANDLFRFADISKHSSQAGGEALQIFA